MVTLSWLFSIEIFSGETSDMVYEIISVEALLVLSCKLFDVLTFEVEQQVNPVNYKNKSH